MRSTLNLRGSARIVRSGSREASRGGSRRRDGGGGDGASSSRRTMVFASQGSCSTLRGARLLGIRGGGRDDRLGGAACFPGRKTSVGASSTYSAPASGGSASGGGPS